MMHEHIKDLDPRHYFCRLGAYTNNNGGKGFVLFPHRGGVSVT